SGDTGQISGLVTNALGGNVLISELVAEKNSFNSRTRPAAQAGRRQFALQRVSDQAAIGIGVADITTAGGVRIHGLWSNGNTFTLGSTLFQEGDAPFYLSYRGGSEVIIGWPQFGLQQGDVVSGDLYWVRSGTNGFSTQLEILPPGP